MAATASQERIAELQRLIPPRPIVPKTRADFRRIARWWDLEAMRGYESSGRSRQYAANQRWIVEMMDNGHKVESTIHGVFIDGLVFGDYIRKNRKHAKET